MKRVKNLGYFTGTYSLQDIKQPPPIKGSWIIRVLKKLLLGLGNPTLFKYVPDSENPFTYVTPWGQVITPKEFLTDGATTPRIFWWKNGLAPYDWIKAAIIHDWLYEAHHNGEDELDFSRSNQLLNPMTELCGVSSCWLRLLICKVAQLLGRNLWDYHYTEAGEPNFMMPVKHSIK